MADCFTLPNVAELVEEKRNYARVIGSITLSCGEMNILAGAYENILAENAKLKAAFDACYEANEDLFNKLADMKAERDAAIAEIVKMCPNCKHASCDWFSKECKDCNHKEKWEWRGVQCLTE